MAEAYREVPTEAPVEPVATQTTQTTTTAAPAATPAAAAPADVSGVAAKEHRITVAERVIYLIGGILMGLLALRFLLRLLAANPANGFADFVYTVTHPFVVPFFGLFNYREQFGASRFEFETLIAIAVYALLTALLARIVALTSRRDR